MSKFPDPPITADPTIAPLLKNTTRSTTWTLTNTTPLNFQTHHPQGLAITPTRLFLTSVEILESPTTYATPRHGYDRSPGKGIGHLFVLDHAGKLEHDIVLQEGDRYHPGGIDYDDRYVWVPLAEYRPNSSASVYRIDAESLDVTKQFEAGDHYGGIVHDRARGVLVGNNWASRGFTAWNLEGKVVEEWTNRSFFVDFQDCQYVEGGRTVCGGVASLPLPGGGSGRGSSKYELGGVTLIDLRTHRILHEVPVSVWSKNGHAVTRNPMKMFVQAGKLRMWVAPDDGDEKGGTNLLIFEVT